ncbi:MAG: hypothetical protein BMS9Abin29_0687 [Gemmatimonadota bacterium]|nr:MAG: hypothetical protein BMS9Abin29_0687 [Gemmatimonadota bacterium]
MALHKLTVLGIVIATLACDNVAWGGAEFSLLPPPSSSDTLDTSAVASEDSSSPDSAAVVVGPVLFMGRRDGNAVSLVAVGEIRGRGLRALPTEEESPGFMERFTRERFAPGSDFTLFAEGVRVGTMVASTTGVAVGFCSGRPTVSGRLELVPEAANAERFLALARSDGDTRPYAPYRKLNHNRDQRVTSLNLMGRVIPTVGATRPPSILEIRRDIQVFNLVDGSPPAIVATFVYGDGLGLGPTTPGAYSVFLMGTDDGTGYATAYIAYRQNDVRGKGTPRFFDRLDWDGDGQMEILLEVAGEESMSLAAIHRRNGQWVELFHDACGGALDSATAAP